MENPEFIKMALVRFGLMSFVSNRRGSSSEINDQKCKWKNIELKHVTIVKLYISL